MQDDQSETPLDRAMGAGGAGEGTPPLGFFAALADTELLLLLEAEPERDQISPRVFDVDGGPIVLAFDTEARLAGFAEGAAAFAALPGRVLAGMLEGQGLRLGINLDVAPSSTLLSVEALAWFGAFLADAGRVGERESRVQGIAPMEQVPSRVLEALSACLEGVAGVADAASLAMATYDDGRRAPLLAVIGVPPEAHGPLARAVQEALVFSGVDAGYLDVVFPLSGDPLAAQMQAAGLQLDLGAVAADAPAAPAGPGMDPGKPPRLR